MPNERVHPGRRKRRGGYHCDIDGKNQYTGNNYEEKGVFSWRSAGGNALDRHS